MSANPTMHFRRVPSSQPPLRQQQVCQRQVRLDLWPARLGPAPVFEVRLSGCLGDPDVRVVLVVRQPRPRAVLVNRRPARATHATPLSNDRVNGPANGPPDGLDIRTNADSSTTSVSPRPSPRITTRLWVKLSPWANDTSTARLG